MGGYLVAIMEWATRKVLSWRMSNTMHAGFCVEALREAIDKFGPPEIMNTDQGLPFTGSAWITTLTEAGLRISMGGRGRCMDTIFIERLWRSRKPEAVCLEENAAGFRARRVIDSRMAFCNTVRPIPPSNAEHPERQTGTVEIGNWRHENQPGYTLDQPPSCPKDRDHFT